MKAREPRAVVLTVVEVEDMLASLHAARTIRDLSGRQRQQLQDAHEQLVGALNRARNGKVQVGVPVLVQILRCATMTQSWLSHILAELYAGSKNEH